MATSLDHAYGHVHAFIATSEGMYVHGEKVLFQRLITSPLNLNIQFLGEKLLIIG